MIELAARKVAHSLARRAGIAVIYVDLQPQLFAVITIVAGMQHTTNGHSSQTPIEY